MNPCVPKSRLLLWCGCVGVALTLAAPASAQQNRSILSVVTIRNLTKEAVAYEVQWPGGPWQACNVAPGEVKLHWGSGEAKKAQLRYKLGTVEKNLQLTGRDFVAQGNSPSRPRDGHIHSFRAGINGAGLVLQDEVPLDKAHLPADRKILEGARERKNFPFLMTNYEVLAPGGGRTYNCISWSIGVTERWIWPGNKVEDFDRLYAPYGYKRTGDLDWSLKPGVHKLVLYGHKRPGGIMPTHAAKQEPNDTWTSKLGGLARIRHIYVEDLNGPSYGEPVAVYVKKI
jgi:hypothetical protein